MQLFVIIAVLAMIQLFRETFFLLLYAVYEPAVIYSDFVFVIIGAILYYLLQPDQYTLGLNFRNIGKGSRIMYTGATVVVVTLFLSSLILFSEYRITNMIMVVKSIILFPVFEELVFRGYLWEKLKRSKLQEYQVLIVVTVLFGIWHLGYWDVIYYNASHNFVEVNMINIMFYKVIIGMIYGFATGFIRMKTKNTYSSILLHSFLNIFGR